MSWMEALNNENTSEINSNMNRICENSASIQNPYKRNKSSRSNGSNKRKAKKNFSSIEQPVEKYNGLNTSKQNNFTNQLISLIKNIHSPKSGKTHNHSHSEVYSQCMKKDGYKTKACKKDEKMSLHVRSNTSGNSKKIKLNQFCDFDVTVKNVANEGK